MELRGEGQTQKDNTGPDYREHSCPIMKSVKTAASSERFFKDHKEGCLTKKLRYMGTIFAFSTPSQPFCY